MKLHRMFFALVALAAVTSVGYVAQRAENPAGRMATAAEAFLASLPAEQKARATFPYDDKERLNWHFVPLQDKNKKSARKGVPLEEMSADQRKAALALVRAGTSDRGYTSATTIMSLESILRELEKGGAMVRNPDWYFFTVFGTPSKTGKWGWRVEGHHLSLNFTMDGGKVVSSTPAFFGANPATVQAGPRKGLRTLPLAEDHARELFKSLDEGQKQAALQPEQHKEIAALTKAPALGAPKGLAGSKMTAPQKDTLMKLITAYAGRMPAEVAEAQLAEVKSGGLDGIHFAYWGGTEPGKPYTYRVHGPAFVIEFINVQADSAKNPANHIHSAWRNTRGDFGVTE